ncbi:hypothetical protein FRC07_005620, partial [Ceratobasidium sp. 392]
MEKYLLKSKSSTASQGPKPERTAGSSSSTRAARHHPYSQPKPTAAGGSSNNRPRKPSGNS